MVLQWSSMKIIGFLSQVLRLPKTWPKTFRWVRVSLQSFPNLLPSDFQKKWRDNFSSHVRAFLLRRTTHSRWDQSLGVFAWCTSGFKHLWFRRFHLLTELHHLLMLFENGSKLWTPRQEQLPFTALLDWGGFQLPFPLNSTMHLFSEHLFLSQLL